VSSCSGPQSLPPLLPPPVVSPLVLSVTSSDGHGWLVTSGSSDPRTPRASRPLNFPFPRIEDWQKKKDRYQRRPGCGRTGRQVSSSPGPCLFSLLVKAVLLSQTKTNFTRSRLPLRRLAEEDTKTGVRGGLSSPAL